MRPSSWERCAPYGWISGTEDSTEIGWWSGSLLIEQAGCIGLSLLKIAASQFRQLLLTCLSVPQVYGQVKRFEKITVEAYDLDGRGFAMDLDELPARVVQHETDHLDGVMFFDRMSETDRQGLEPQIDEFVTVFRHQQSTGESPSDEELAEQLAALERDGFGG